MVSIYKDNPHYFAFEGQPVFLTGVNYANVIYDQGVGFRTQNEKLGEIGATCSRVVSFRTERYADRLGLLPWARKAGEQQARDGGAKFDLGRFDEGYWGRARDYVRDCLQRRLAVDFEVFDALSFRGHADAFWALHPFNPSNNVNLVEADLASDPLTGGASQFYRALPDLDDNLVLRDYQEAWVAKLLAESAPFGNCIYSLAGEHLPGTRVESHTKEREFIWNKYWARLIAEYATGRDTQVLCAVRPGPDLDASDRERYLAESAFSSLEICDLIAGANAREMSEECRRWLGLAEEVRVVKPVFASEIHYQDRPRNLWVAFVSGLAGACLVAPASRDFESHYRLVSHLVKFIKDMWFWQMKPHPELVSAQEAYCLAAPEEEYVVYVIGGGKLELDLREAAGELALEWYDPLLGFYCHEGEVTGGRAITLEVPYELRTDAVLHLQKL